MRAVTRRSLEYDEKRVIHSVLVSETEDTTIECVFAFISGSSGGKTTVDFG
ncbi:unnamed protein product, partial [Nesidiocoris tenuis]